jgi:hypothetical protein
MQHNDDHRLQVPAKLYALNSALEVDRTKWVCQGAYKPLCILHHWSVIRAAAERDFNFWYSRPQLEKRHEIQHSIMLTINAQVAMYVGK